MKNNKKDSPTPKQPGLNLNDLHELYSVLQSCNNNPGVHPATVHYARKIKKSALGHLTSYETGLNELMEEYKVPKQQSDDVVNFIWAGMKNEKLIAGLVSELQKETYTIDNLNQLSQTEFIKHTRGLSESQMDIFEKYLVKQNS